MRRRSPRRPQRVRRRGSRCRSALASCSRLSCNCSRRTANPTSAGRIASAGIVAANVLRHLGRTAEADVVAAEAAAAVAEGRPQRLVQAINAVLEGAPAARAAEPAAVRRHGGRAQTLRVNADRIDALVRLTGELTVAKNAIGHAVKLATSEGSALAVALKNQHASLDRLVGELQRAVVGMRVLPLRVAFQRFPRLIHELAAELGKPATLVIEGEDTEADKAIVEILVEPLVHVLRNAMDHGVENAATTRCRRQAGRRARSACARSAKASTSSSKSPTTAAGSTSRAFAHVAAERNVVDGRRARGDERRAAHRPDFRAGIFDGRPRSRRSPDAASAWTRSARR